MGVLACPGCGVKIKVPEGKYGRLNCPKCSRPLVIKAPNAAGDAATNPVAPPRAPVAAGRQPPATPAPAPPDPLFGSFPQTPAAAGAGWSGPPMAVAPRKAQGAAGPLKDFLKPLGIGVGVFSGLLAALGVGGLFSEPVALTACIVGIGGSLIMLFSARIWVIVLAFQETIAQGLLVLLVPYYWLAYIATRKGRSLRALALLIASLIPLLICLGMLALFLPRYQPGGGRPGTERPGISQANLEKLKTQIRESQASSPHAQVLQTVTYRLFNQLGQPVDRANAEQILSELPGFVPGSFRHDAPGRTITFQYRGDRSMGPRYGLYLAGKARMVMSATPTFSEGPLPAETGAATSPTTPPNPASPETPPLPRNEATTAASDDRNTLRTISFPTLAQDQVDPAAAERVLASVSGYVPGSFRFDPQNQAVTLQYRGTVASAPQFGFALQRAQIMVRLKPTFTDAN